LAENENDFQFQIMGHASFISPKSLNMFARTLSIFLGCFAMGAGGVFAQAVSTTQTPGTVSAGTVRGIIMLAPSV